MVNNVNPLQEHTEATFARIETLIRTQWVRDHSQGDPYGRGIPDLKIEHISSADCLEGPLDARGEKNEPVRITVVRCTGVTHWRGSAPDLPQESYQMWRTAFHMDGGDVEMLSHPDHFYMQGA